MRQTEFKDANIKKSLRSSIGAGFSTIGGSSKKTYYVIQHKNSSQFHKEGEEQKIILDAAELGRSPKCEIRFDEKYQTVHRKHAMIYRKGENWKIKHMSPGGNPLLVNGRPVEQEWFLSNGDEIQLSLEGPVMGFIVPQNPSVKSIKLSARLDLFAKQVLRPYKTVFSAILVVLIVGIGTLGYLLWDKSNQYDNIIATMQHEFDQYEGVQDSIQNAQAKVIQELKSRPPQVIYETPDEVSGTDIEALYPDVYYVAVEMEIDLQGQVQTMSLSGTGFLLDDGTFVTARHCVHPLLYDDARSNYIHVLSTQRGSGVSISGTLYAFSHTGKQFEFDIDDFNYNDGEDEIVNQDVEGQAVQLIKPAMHQDWAAISTNSNGILKAGYEESANLEVGEDLHILGFPQGVGANSIDDITPQYSQCDVSQAGLLNGYIMSNNRAMSKGNSGGPVFVNSSDGFEVIGIVSSGRGESVGQFVPIKNIR